MSFAQRLSFPVGRLWSLQLGICHGGLETECQ